MKSIILSSTLRGHNIELRKVSTAELAETILAFPDNIISVATHLDEEDRSKEWPWYGIVCAKIFDVWSVFINQWSMFGGAPYMFDLPDFDEDVDVGIGEEQSVECFEQMINGLNCFRKHYSLDNDNWYVNDEDTERIKILYW